VLAPVPPAEPPPPEPEPREEPARVTRPRTPPRAAGPTEPRPEPAPETPAAPAPTAPETARPEAAAPSLQTPQTADDAAAERRIKEALARAGRGLEAVKRADLSADARQQFDTARRFIDQSSEALRVHNYMFAAYLAEKAEALARGLSGR
jgi:outer membrane biosynthesis protein TonB